LVGVKLKIVPIYIVQHTFMGVGLMLIKITPKGGGINFFINSIESDDFKGGLGGS
jgi:hypothetical protein